MTAALLDVLGVDLGPDELLALTRQVENDVVGAPTGGLDQLASLPSISEAERQTLLEVDDPIERARVLATASTAMGPRPRRTVPR